MNAIIGFIAAILTFATALLFVFGGIDILDQFRREEVENPSLIQRALRNWWGRQAAILGLVIFCFWLSDFVWEGIVRHGAVYAKMLGA